MLFGKINKELTDRCRPEIRKSREKHKDKIDSSCILTQDILFGSPSGAAGFVAGNSASGNDKWKDKNGKSLKELEQ